MESLLLPVDRADVINMDNILLLSGLEAPPENLLENGFTVVAPHNPTDNPVSAFRRLENWDQPVYVSSGITLHLLHIFFDQILQDLEEEVLADELTSVCSSLYRVNLQRGCRMNAAFFAVPLSYLDSGFQPDNSISEDVQAELALIEEHAGYAESPLMGYEEDYSQYVPRGHYTASRELENYFKAMMWLGRLTFILNGGEPFGPAADYLVSREDARTMTACALFTVSDLGSIQVDGETLLEKWKRIYEITAFFAGFADDLSVPDYAQAALETGGLEVSAEVLQSEDFYSGFSEYVNTAYASPSIYSGTGNLISMPDDRFQPDPTDLQEAFVKTMGFRFLGQRYAPDSEILGKLVFPAVGAAPDGRRRYMPSGLDVAACFGLEIAEHALEERGAFRFDFYADSLTSLSEKIHSLSPEEWHSTLYMSWLHCLYLLGEEKGDGYPAFMQTEAWNRHTLSNFLASWAMLRHDTILYVKQSYTMRDGASAPDEQPVPSAGFVEPVPEVYAELNATLQMAQRGLEDYGVLSEELERRFANACGLMTRLQEIAERELAGERITESDADFLKSFASSLESSIAWREETTEGLETSLVADVHTDQNSGTVLEVASGNLDRMIVIYRRPDGAAEAAVGPVLSYYEFTWPMGERLTDEAWRQLLGSDTQPGRPQWLMGILAW
ncbi:MAG: DUF3160 domain-containing protein [Candidatus Aegiribacteria sp.]|nr:DUF3160 domain-containing protein [Candidatus Aegiribacteria sp.]MBD3293897.1 DUF3160 domain-containing protein [Candidatus Fermentibacteria bacterium]